MLSGVKESSHSLVYMLFQICLYSLLWLLMFSLVCVILSVTILEVFRVCELTVKMPLSSGCVFCLIVYHSSLPLSLFPSLPLSLGCKSKILIMLPDRLGAWCTALHPSRREGHWRPVPCLVPERRSKGWAAGAILLCTEKQLGSILDEWGVH